MDLGYILVVLSICSAPVSPGSGLKQWINTWPRLMTLPPSSCYPLQISKYVLSNLDTHTHVHGNRESQSHMYTHHYLMYRELKKRTMQPHVQCPHNLCTSHRLSTIQFPRVKPQCVTACHHNGQSVMTTSPHTMTREADSSPTHWPSSILPAGHSPASAQRRQLRPRTCSHLGTLPHPWPSFCPCPLTPQSFTFPRP